MDEYIKKLEATGDYRITKRLKPTSHYFKDDVSKKRIGIFLDTETTGLNSDSDKIMEIYIIYFLI